MFDWALNEPLCLVTEFISNRITNEEHFCLFVNVLRKWYINIHGH